MRYSSCTPMFSCNEVPSLDKTLLFVDFTFQRVIVFPRYIVSDYIPLFLPLQQKQKQKQKQRTCHVPKTNPEPTYPSQFPFPITSSVRPALARRNASHFNFRQIDGRSLPPKKRVSKERHFPLLYFVRQREHPRARRKKITQRQGRKKDKDSSSSSPSATNY